MTTLFLAFAGSGLMLWCGLQVDVPMSLCIGVYVVWAVLVWILPKPKFGLGLLFLSAAILRLMLWFCPPIFSDDVFRYVWEGSLTAGGGNPYLTPPADFTPEDTSVHQWINHSHIPSIYPPVSMIVFALVGFFSATVGAMKATFLFVDLAVLGVLCKLLIHRKQGTEAAWLYALHPLPIVELSGSGHMDGLAILFMLLAFWAYENGRSGSFWLVIGGGAKILPAVLLARHFRITDTGFWAGFLLLVLVCLPFVSEPFALVDALLLYTQKWSFNGSIFVLLKPIFGGLTRPLLMLMGFTVVIYGLYRKIPLIELSLWVCGGWILLSPTVHPWYVLWVWVPSLLCRSSSWTALASMVPLSYVVLLSRDVESGHWTPSLWPSLVIYGIFALVAFIHYHRHSSLELNPK